MIERATWRHREWDLWDRERDSGNLEKGALATKRVRDSGKLGKGILASKRAGLGRDRKGLWQEREGPA